MGQKIHPKGIRLGYIKDWDSKWFNLREMPNFIEEDFRIRNYLKDKLQLAALSKVVIERAGKYVRVNLLTARPGIVIGKGGQMLKEIGSAARVEIEKMLEKPVYLELRVKVRKDWRKDEQEVRRMGYSEKP